MISEKTFFVLFKMDSDEIENGWDLMRIVFFYKF